MKKYTRVLLSAIVACFVSMIGLTTAFAAGRVTVKPGDTLWKISQNYNISVQSLESANPGIQPNNLQVGAELNLPSTAKTYTIQPGDTLWLISKRYGVSLLSLKAANPNVNYYNLIPGTTINIPSSQGTSPSSSNLYWMAHAIHAEAMGEPLKAQIAVGDVIWHRMKSSQFPDSVYNVVFQKINGYYQFTCVANGTIYEKPNANSWKAAEDVLKYHDDYVPGAYVFFTPSKTPSDSWVWSQPRVATIGDFIFAK